MGRNGPPHRETIDRILRTSGDAAALFAPGFSNLAHEELRVAHLDEEGRILGVSAGADGNAASIILPLREIVRDAIALGARALVLAHNHPSGDPTPSPADKAATRRLAEIVGGLDIRLLDHLVFAGEGCRSFRQMGLL
jgi:DNA repair protein RadC